MKLNSDYRQLHNAIQKFKDDKELSNCEKECILELLNATEGDYYPTLQELEIQESRVEIVNGLDYDKNRKYIEKLLELSKEFENKYC